MKIIADDSLFFHYYHYFSENKGLTLHVNPLQGRDPMKCQALFNLENTKKKKSHKFDLLPLWLVLCGLNLFMQSNHGKGIVNLSINKWSNSEH